LDPPNKNNVKVLILDTSALVMGLNPSGLNLSTYSVPGVMEELIPDTMSHARFITSMNAGRLIVESPTQSSMTTVRETSSKVGDAKVLSKADIEVVALALDLKKNGLSPAIVSDDYAVQNLSETLGIEHASLATLGIARKFDWIYYCPACFRRYGVEDAGQVCRVCGTRLKRKVIRKEKAIRKVGRKQV
jgi:endoribonuclease Nob1